MTGFYGDQRASSPTTPAPMSGPTRRRLDSIEKAIAALRSGSALAEPDIAVFHPEDWSHLRRLKNTLGNFLLAPTRPPTR